VRRLRRSPNWGTGAGLRCGAGALARIEGVNRRAESSLRACVRRRKSKIARLGEPGRARLTRQPVLGGEGELIFQDRVDVVQ
jgi:hypothetical protein